MIPAILQQLFHDFKIDKSHFSKSKPFAETLNSYKLRKIILRWGSRTAATSKVEPFVIIVNGFQPLTIITKISTLDVAAVLVRL